MFSYTVPDYEIQLSNEPVALMLTTTGKIKPYKIRPRGGYFVIYSNEIKGIFSINNKYRWLWGGKTPCFFYSIKNMNPLDPELVHEVNQFAKKHKLTKLKQKDLKKSKQIRFFSKGNKEKEEKALQTVKEQSQEDQISLNQALRDGEQELNQTVEDYEKEHNKKITLDPKKSSLWLLDFLNKKGLLSKVETDTFIYKIENEILSYDQLIEELRENEFISVAEPLNLDCEVFLEDFGSQDPINMSGHVDDLRANPKGLKDMTSKPVKQFITGGVIIAAGLVVIMAIAILPGILEGGAGGMFDNFSLPFLP